MAVHEEDYDILQIKEENFNPDEITAESQTSHVQQNEEHFVNCVQGSNMDTKVEIFQGTWAPNAAYCDKFISKKPSTCPSIGTIKGDDEIENKEQVLQDEASLESQRLHLQKNEVYFVEFKDSSYVDSKVGIKQEPWDPNGESGDIKYDLVQSPNLDPVPYLRTSSIKGDDKTNIKEELWCCDETSADSLNEREENNSKSNEAAEDVALLQSSRSYPDMGYSTSTIQLQENKSTGSLSATPSPSDQKCETNHRYKTCEKRFKSLSHLKTHNLQCKMSQWRNCDKDCTYSGGMIDQLIHSNIRKYLCDICGKTFSKMVNLKVHLLVHDDKRQYKCQICEKTFKDPSNLNTHLLLHNDKRQYKCQICEKSFKQLPGLKSHLLIHDEKCHYKCQICGTKFRHLSSLKRHLLVHDNKRLYKCQICEKSFKQFPGLKAHLLVHDDKRQFKCEICATSFKQLGHLKTHLSVHDDKRQFKCEFCATSFKHLGHLKTHLLVHDDKRQYKCEICTKSFKRLTHFKTHLLVHDDNRQFKCEICAKSFKRFTHMKRHLLVHDDKRQYKCQVCGESYKHLSSLKSHLLLHEDRSKLNCEICAKSFKHLSSLKRHLLIHGEKSNASHNFVQKELRG